MRSIFILIAAILLTCQPVFADEPITPMSEFAVSNLLPGQSLKVSYVSSGCFHRNRGDIVITDGKAQILNIKANNDEEFVPYTLTFDEIVEIDRYIAWLSKQDGVGGCTSSLSYKLEIIEGNKVVKSGSFRDDWCGYGMPEEPIMGFASLHGKIFRLGIEGFPNSKVRE